MFGAGFFLLLLQLLLRGVQIVPQLFQLGFESASLLANLARLLFGLLPPLGFFGQIVGQPLDLLLDFGLRRLRFPDSCFELRLVLAGFFLLLTQLLLGLVQLWSQLFELGFESASLLTDLGCLLFGSLPSPGFSGQIFGQVFDLFLDLGLCRLRFANACFQLRLLVAGLFLLLTLLL